MKKIIVLQHTQSLHYVQGLVGGWTDLDLTDLGRTQAETIGKALAKEFQGMQFVMFSSDLLRAKSTAEIIGMYVNSKPIFRKELREAYFGIATNQSQEWFKTHQNTREKGVPLIYHRMIEGAETGEELYKRVSLFVKEIDSLPDENIIVVAHGGSIHMFVALWLGIPIDVLEKVAFIGSSGGVSIMAEREDGSRMLNQWNNTSYMYTKCE